MKIDIFLSKEYFPANRKIVDETQIVF